MSRAERVDRAKVIETAAALADEAGSLDQITLADVAGVLGIRVPSLYNHVDGLAGLRRGVALSALHDLTAELQAAAVGRAGDDALIAIAHAYRAFAHRAPGRYGATLRSPEPDDEELTAVAQQFLEWIFRVLQPYQLSEAEMVHVVRSFRSIIHGFVALENTGAFRMPVMLDESYDYLIRMFLAALRASPT